MLLFAASLFASESSEILCSRLVIFESMALMVWTDGRQCLKLAIQSGYIHPPDLELFHCIEFVIIITSKRWARHISAVRDAPPSGHWWRHTSPSSPPGTCTDRTPASPSPPCLPSFWTLAPVVTTSTRSSKSCPTGKLRNPRECWLITNVILQH